MDTSKNLLKKKKSNYLSSTFLIKSESTGKKRKGLESSVTISKEFSLLSLWQDYEKVFKVKINMSTNIDLPRDNVRTLSSSKQLLLLLWWVYVAVWRWRPVVRKLFSDPVVVVRIGRCWLLGVIISNLLLELIGNCNVR